MSLTAFVPEDTPTTGTSGTQTRPITEGQEVAALDNQQTQSGGMWGWLDDLGAAASRTFETVTDAYAERAANRITGAESTVDTTGSESDQPGGQTPNNQQSNVPFYEKYKTELMISGGVLAAMAVLYFVTRD